MGPHPLFSSHFEGFPYLLSTHGVSRAAGVVLTDEHMKGVVDYLTKEINALTHMKGMQGWMLAHYGKALSDGQLLAGGLALHTLFWTSIAMRGLIPAAPLVMMLGGLTYPLYLLHQNIGYVLINALAPHAGHALAPVAALLIVTALAWAVWRHVETPGRRAVSTLLHGIVRLADRLPDFGAALRRN